MDPHPLSHLVRKLRMRARIGDEAEAAILALPHTRKTHDAPAYLIREGSLATNVCSMLVSGYAFRQKTTSDGARQIVSFHMRGDLLDLQHLFLRCADHSVQALTNLEVVNIDREALQRLIFDHREIGEALWVEALVDASIFREWVVNVGRRDARARVAHLLCEFAMRMQQAGLGNGQSCQMPITQEQLGDAVGLTSVHVNRTLKALEADGFIQRNKREISFTSWKAIRSVGDFSSLYLHMDETDQNGGLKLHQ